MDTETDTKKVTPVVPKLTSLDERRTRYRVGIRVVIVAVAANRMKARYRLIRRGTRGDAFYGVDTKTGKRTSLGTADRDAAEQILFAKNQAERQPRLKRKFQAFTVVF